MRRVVILSSILLFLPPLSVAPVTAQLEGAAEPQILATAETLGTAAVSVTLVAEETVTCDLEIHVAGRSGGSRIMLIESDHGTGWFHSTSMDLAHLHIDGVVDTREVDHGGWSASTMWLNGFTFDGTWAFTMAGSDLQQWPEEIRERWPWTPIPGEHSVRMILDCDGTPSVSVTGGREVAILTPHHAETGIGASAFIAGSAILDGRTGGDISAPDVRFRSGSFGTQAGLLAVNGPDTEAEWLLSPLSSEIAAVDGGPGEWAVTLHRTGVYFEAFWALLMGLHPVASFDEVATLPTLE